ncbi:MAG: tRNA (cytosine(32)/uridine(32)-2'-O)-methyltransferase TrmJ [Porticoccaceae bacterium]|jgi:tRNA (cytidine32/uridine32-2'-O)-methyltransferase|nr:tRNA (cytosine(32)/uridine(32)-2'-O)-methyltransferase TrmJ [Porticoccaceae bacterium]
MQDSFQNLRFVLVNTSQPGNIGGAARAIKNMGFSDLVLVQPEIFPSDRARWRAAGAGDVLKQARVVDSFADAIADCQLVIGTSARERRIPWPLVNPRLCADQVAAEAGDHKIALVFGREDSGLTNEELQRCNLHVHIPTNPDYSSLNLCAAVQVLAYEVRMSLLASTGELKEVEQEWDEPPATSEELENFIQHLEQSMIESGFLDPETPRQTMTRMRRMFSRIRPDQSEVAILRGLLSSFGKKK